MGQLWVRAAWIGSITLLLGGLSAQPALAAPLTLDTETLSDNSNTTVTGDCAVGSFSFSTSGTAVGPYIGTYNASGKLTLDPTTDVITAFSEDFTITSTVTIVGHKALATPVGAASCTGSSGGAALILFSNIPATYTATIPNGSGGTFIDSGNASVSITLVNEGFGPKATFHQTFTSTGTTPGFPTNNGGTFVVGDLEANAPPVIGNTVTWWSSQWAKINQMSGGPPPSSMKGFAGFEDMPLPSPLPPLTKLCGMTWTTDTGNSTPPPPSVPQEMLVIVSSHVTQNGSVISGDIRELIAVKNNPGYAPNPGHTGSGVEETIIC